MISYWKDLKQRKTYKMDPDTRDGVVHLFWVQVHMNDDGSFIHARGRDIINTKENAEKILKETALPYTEQGYIDSLKDYFAIDKKVREQFIKQYKL
tara:strand:- start:286 stop:573 length:288 start_codon:yes stop_codon:yes gene_type:complete